MGARRQRFSQGSLAMKDQEPHEAGAEHRAQIETKSITAPKPQSHAGSEVILVDGRSVATESPGAAVGLPGSEVIVASAGEPMSELSGKVLWFEPFEIRRPKGVLEITVRIVRGTVALYISFLALALVASCVRLVLGGRQGFQPDPVLWYIEGAIS